MPNTIVRIFGNAVVEAPNYRALVRAEGWHRRRIAALTEQSARTSVVLSPRRGADLHEQIEQHEAAIRDIRAGKEVIAAAAETMRRPCVRAAEVAVVNDCVMATDWRAALEAVEAELVSRDEVD